MNYYGQKLQIMCLLKQHHMSFLILIAVVTYVKIFWQPLRMLHSQTLLRFVILLLQVPSRGNFHQVHLFALSSIAIRYMSRAIIITTLITYCKIRHIEFCSFAHRKSWLAFHTKSFFSGNSLLVFGSLVAE